MTPSLPTRPMDAPNDPSQPPILRLTSDDPVRSALVELSNAADRFSGATSDARPRRRRPRFVAPLAVAILTGSIVFFAEKAEHRCTATFRIPPDAVPARRAFLRRELLDAAWNRFAACVQDDRPLNWFVDSPSADFFRLVLLSENAEVAVESLRAIAAGYLDRLRTLARTERETPSEAESLLTDYLEELRARFADAQQQVDGAVAALPAGDPNQKRDALREQWRKLRGDFDAARQELTDASGTLLRVRGEPQPTQGLVTAGERESAIAGEPALVADLDELRVRLTELKRTVLGVLEASAAPLSTLETSADDLLSVLSPEKHPNGAEAFDRLLAELTVAFAGYADLLHTLATDWNRERQALETAEPDPKGAELLQVHARARDRLSQFLFAAGKHMATLRSGVAKISEFASDNARFHVWHSDLVRGFQVLQSCHHRFEFVASRIEGSENFRLDAALRSALGLRRRTQETLESIETRLRNEAAERARQRRQAELSAAAVVVERVRSATDATIDELVSLQDAINLSSDLSEEFHRAMVRLEASTNRLQVTQSYLRVIEGRVGELQAKRRTDRDSAVELVSCGVVDPSVNFTARVRTGGAAAGIALALVAAAQWWFSRSTRRS